MRIQFCGADRTVTGSSHLVEINGLRLFLDMGMYQGPRDEAQRINQYLPADVKTADAMILSHGHLDHCGKLPVAAKAGFTGPIYCTPATAAVAAVVLEDSATIQLENIEYLNDRRAIPSSHRCRRCTCHRKCRRCTSCSETWSTARPRIWAKAFR